MNTKSIYYVLVNEERHEFTTKEQAFRFAFDSMPANNSEFSITVKRIQRG